MAENKSPLKVNIDIRVRTKMAVYWITEKTKQNKIKEAWAVYDFDSKKFVFKKAVDEKTFLNQIHKPYGKYGDLVISDIDSDDYKEALKKKRRRLSWEKLQEQIREFSTEDGPRPGVAEIKRNGKVVGYR